MASERAVTNSWLEGDIIITSHQTSGKGQRGISCESEPDQNLTFSIIIKPKILEVVIQFDLTIAVSLGITTFLNTLKPGFKIKWPNDIYFGERKICGILIQNNLKGKFLDTSIIGIGLNINQNKLDNPKATSLAQNLNKKQNLPHILEGVCLSVEAKYLQLKSNQIAPMKDEYLSQLLGIGEPRSFESEHTFQGKIMGVSSTGKLIINVGNSLQEFDLKEIKFL